MRFDYRIVQLCDCAGAIALLLYPEGTAVCKLDFPSYHAEMQTNYEEVCGWSLVDSERKWKEHKANANTGRDWKGKVKNYELRLWLPMEDYIDSFQGSTEEHRQTLGTKRKMKPTDMEIDNGRSTLQHDFTGRVEGFYDVHMGSGNLPSQDEAGFTTPAPDEMVRTTGLLCPVG